MLRLQKRLLLQPQPLLQRRLKKHVDNLVVDGKFVSSFLHAAICAFCEGDSAIKFLYFERFQSCLSLSLFHSNSSECSNPRSELTWMREFF